MTKSLQQRQRDAVVRAVRAGLAPLVPAERRELYEAEIYAEEAAEHAADAREAARHALAVAKQAARVVEALRQRQHVQ
jgi:hypothetical protein